MNVTVCVDIEAPPARVWEFLVEPETAKSWFHALEQSLPAKPTTPRARCEEP